VPEPQTSIASIAARLDRLPPSRYLREIVALISIGGFFELYDLFMNGYIAVGFIKAGIFAPTTRGLLDVHGFASFVGAGFAGMFVGTLLFSWFSDHYGRRATFTFSLIWYSVATLVMAFMNTAATIAVWRFICGIGIGVQLVTISSYITEITPRNARGRYIAFSQFISFCGVPAVAGISLAAIPHTIFGLAGWRYVAMMGAGGILLVWKLRAGMPESPRWLEAHGRKPEAEATLRHIEERVAGETQGSLPQPEAEAEPTPQERGAWMEIWRSPYLRRTVMLTIFNAFQAIGFYGFAAWIPVLLINEGIEVTRSLAYVLVMALLNPFGSLLAMRFADSFERKWQIASLALISAGCGLIWAQQRSAAGIIFFGAAITLANSWFSCSLHTYQTELYPTRIRAQAVGFVYSWSRFTSIFGSFIIAQALHAYGTTGVFVIVATAMLVVAVVVGTLGPNSTRMRLETLSR
jgi:putative MFS transporter